MVGHHLIFGDLEDYLTGEVLKDTHDERYRQKLARLLVERKGFSKSEISPRMALRVQAGDKCAIIKIDLGVVLSKQMYMIIKYGPGSIVTRHRPALAASRLLTTYQIPVVAVTNGELDFGPWEQIFYGEFDGRRKKRVMVKIIGE